MRPLVGVGLLTSEGDTWKLHHKIALSSFQLSRYKNAVTGMGERTEVLLNKWSVYGQSGEQFELDSEMSRLTLDNIGVAVFGSHFNAVEKDQACIFNSVTAVLREMQKRAQQLYPIFLYYPKFLQREFLQSIQQIRDIVQEKIIQRKSTMQDGTFYLLDAMLEAQTIHQLSDEEILDEMVTWVMGGHETTAALLCWVLYCLDLNPQVEDKLMEELEECNPFKGIPTFDSLQKMEYLTMIIKETLRMFPPAPILNRTTSEDVELGGYKIPKNTEILISPWVVQRSSKYWDSSDEFIPQRWKEDHSSPFVFSVFGAGPRTCLGKTFAFMEAKVVICMMVQRFKMKFANKEVKTECTITLRAKHGLWCEVINRK